MSIDTYVCRGYYGRKIGLSHIPHSLEMYMATGAAKLLNCFEIHLKSHQESHNIYK